MDIHLHPATIRPNFYYPFIFNQSSSHEPYKWMVQFIKQWNGFSLIFKWNQQYVKWKTTNDWLVGLWILNMDDRFITTDTKTFEYCRTNSVGWLLYSKRFYWNIVSDKLPNLYNLFEFNGVLLLLFSPWDCCGYKFLF